MPRIIIGHVTDTTAKIWVRGYQEHPDCEVKVFDGANQVHSGAKTLEERHFWTAALPVSGLRPATGYRATVTFKGPSGERTPIVSSGLFRTAPAPGQNAQFRFLMGSCNLHSLGIVSRPDRAFEELSSVAHAESAAFMLHLGDQIYADVPNPMFMPSMKHYRNKYLDAWEDCEPATRFLAELPQYMTLDDHEICNNFSNDMDNAHNYLWPAVKAYREFQHIRQPDNYGLECLYYSFEWGGAAFFVTDTRTERYKKGANACVIGPTQEQALLGWASTNRNRLRFIVSSVPFVAETRSDTSDKWCAAPFLPQRNRIVDQLDQMGGNGKIVFLVGDMHNSHHAELTVAPGGRVIHELMSSPLNQLDKSGLDRYQSPGPVHQLPGGGSYTTRINTLYGKHSNAMLVTVDPAAHGVRWEVFRTKQAGRNEASGVI